MSHITLVETVNRPVEQVFAYVDDYKNTTKYMKDLTRWQPEGAKNHGKGAVFAVAMKAGPKELDSVVDIVEWTENKVIAWKSKSGFKQTGKWAFRSKGDATEVTFDMEYDLGGGIAGKVLAKVAEPVVRMNLQSSVKALKTKVEALPRAAKAPPKPAAKKAPAKSTTAKR